MRRYWQQRTDCKFPIAPPLHGYFPQYPLVTLGQWALERDTHEAHLPGWFAWLHDDNQLESEPEEVWLQAQFLLCDIYTSLALVRLAETENNDNNNNDTVFLYVSGQECNEDKIARAKSKAAALMYELAKLQNVSVAEVLATERHWLESWLKTQLDQEGQKPAARRWLLHELPTKATGTMAGQDDDDEEPAYLMREADHPPACSWGHHRYIEMGHFKLQVPPTVAPQSVLDTFWASLLAQNAWDIKPGTIVAYRPQ